MRISCWTNNGTCESGQVFGFECGTLNGSLSLSIEVNSLSRTAEWLQVLGISNVQTIIGGLDIWIYWNSFPSFAWSNVLFPNLEVVRGPLSIRIGEDMPLTIGPWFGRLRAVQRLTINDNGRSFENSNLGFLTGLQCIGWQMALTGGPPNLYSLGGLQGVVDGNPTQAGVQCVFDIRGTGATLTDVSALAAYARCGPNQRPNSDSAPCLATTCGNINSWSALCSYIANGTCTALVNLPTSIHILVRVVTVITQAVRLTLRHFLAKAPA